MYANENMKHDIIKQANHASKEIARINKEEDIHEELLDKQRTKAFYKYQDQIDKIRSEQREVEREFEEKKEKLNKEATDEIMELRPAVEKLKRILELMEITKREKPSLKLKANNRGKEIILIDEPRKDQYIRLYVYIYENDKPKNKYSLAIVGKHIFNSDMLPRESYPTSYFKPYFENNNASFTVNIKDAPTKEELIKFYEKADKNGLWVSGHFANLVKEYEFVLENCNTPEWEKEYLLDQKDYYENRYSNGIAQPEYKKVIKRLKALK